MNTVLTSPLRGSHGSNRERISRVEEIEMGNIFEIGEDDKFVGSSRIYVLHRKFVEIAIQ